MLFNSYEFIACFLPLTLVIYYGLEFYARRSLALAWLVAASLAFYGAWKPAHLPVLLFSLAVNYALACVIGRAARGRRVWLIVGTAFNLGLLGYYKYTHFFVSTLAAATDVSFRFEPIALPLAISFFTFQQLAYLVDCYRGEVGTPRLLDFFLFVTFFPQLIAGPIVRHGDLLPQFAQRPRGRVVPWEPLAQGLTLFSLGLAKKVLLADQLAAWATPVFDAASQGVCPAASDAWGAMLAYTFQLYFDFSGYSDMAIGLGLLFGIRLPVNFNSPYQATSIGDFWNRWHMTLSSFLRQYLFLPLGGSPRRRPWQAARNLLLTMTLCGLWHGAGWTFVLFGFLHGLLMSAHHTWRLHFKHRLGISIPRPMGWGLTFGAFALSLVLFRASDLPAAATIYRSLVGLGDAASDAGPLRFLEVKDWLRIGLGFPFVLAFPNAVECVLNPRLKWRWQLQPAYAAAAAALLVTCLLRLNENSEFLYFHF